MGFRFRKSIKLGNSRLTFSKSGISASTGIKGARIGASTSGKTRATLSVPGTGISYVAESSGRKKGENKMNQNTPGKYAQKPKKPSDGKGKKILAWFCVVLFAFCALGSSPSFASVLFLAALILTLPIQKLQNVIGTFLKPGVKLFVIMLLGVCAFFMIPTTETAVPQERNIVAPTETKPETTAATAEATIQETTIPETIIPETEATEAPITETTAPTPIERDYVLNTSSMKIHKPGCKSVKDIKDGNRQDYHGTFESLTNRGYTGCKNCNPY